MNAQRLAQRIVPMMALLMALLMALSVSLSMQAGERGKFIHVDATVNKNLKPQLAFSQEHKDGKDVTTLLVKFADGKAVRLNRTAAEVAKEKKYSDKKGNATITFFPTVSEYEVTPEVIAALEAGVAIVKVRIVFKENEAKDYDIAEGYQAKMAGDLLKSYQEASQKNQKANGDLSDEDF